MNRAFRSFDLSRLRPGALEQPRVREERAHAAGHAARLLLPHADALRVGGGLPRGRGGRPRDAPGAAAAAGVAAPRRTSRAPPARTCSWPTPRHVAERIAALLRARRGDRAPARRRRALPRAASASRGDYYLVFGRVVPYKRVDLAVAACARLGRPAEGRRRRPRARRRCARRRPARASSSSARSPSAERDRAARRRARAAVPGRGGLRDRAGRGAGGRACR